MSNPNNAAPSTAAKKEAKKGLRRYTSLIAMIVLFLVFTVATLAFSAWVTVQQTQTGKELVVVTRQGRLVAQFARAAFNFKTYVDDYTKKKKACSLLLRPQPASLLWRLASLPKP